MLGGKNNSSSRDISIPKKEGTLNTIIGKGTYVKGEIRVDSTIRVDGRFEGLLKAEDTVIIGETGELNAEIEAKHITVGGKIQGNVKASGSVVLEANSLLQGDLRTKSLIINEGALLNGKCVMTDDTVKKPNGAQGAQRGSGKNN